MAGDSGKRGKKLNNMKSGDRRDRSGRPKQVWVDPNMTEWTGEVVPSKGFKGAVPKKLTSSLDITDTL